MKGDEFYIQYSSICECYWLMRVPAWAIERAGNKGFWRNDDGDEYVPSDMATIEGTYENRLDAEKALNEVRS